MKHYIILAGIWGVIAGVMGCINDPTLDNRTSTVTGTETATDFDDYAYETGTSTSTSTGTAQ